MSTITVTLRGWVAKDAMLVTNTQGRQFASFRMAVTPRRWDSLTKAWVDQQTEWFTVNVYREDAIHNVAHSIKAGSPVIVTGRLFTRERQGDTRWFFDKYVAADAVGLDLNFGEARFVRTKVEAQPAEAPADHEVAAEPVGISDVTGLEDVDVPPLFEPPADEPGGELVGAGAGMSSDTPPF